jgi:hypothetical protein
VITTPTLGSEEFKQVKAEWDQKLADDGFDDIERPPACREGSDPTLQARHAAYHRDYIRPDNPANLRHVPLGDIIALEEGDTGQRSPVSEMSLWDSRFDLLAEALHRFRFTKPGDRQIVEAIVAGEPHRDLMARLGVGRPRVRRVLTEIRAWARR